MHTLDELTYNTCLACRLAKLFIWMRYPYVWGYLVVIPIAGDKMIIIAAASLFANWSTGYNRAIVVSDADSVIIDQVRVWRVTPLKLDHGCINRWGTYWNGKVLFYQEKNIMFLITFSIPFNYYLVFVFWHFFCFDDAYYLCCLDILTVITCLVIGIIGTVAQTGVCAGTP